MYLYLLPFHPTFWSNSHKKEVERHIVKFRATDFVEAELGISLALKCRPHKQWKLTLKAGLSTEEVLCGLESARSVTSFRCAHTRNPYGDATGGD